MVHRVRGTIYFKYRYLKVIGLCLNEKYKGEPWGALARPAGWPAPTAAEAGLEVQGPCRGGEEQSSRHQVRQVDHCCKFRSPVLRIWDVDPWSEFFHPRSWIPDTDPHQRIHVFLTQKIVSKLSEIWFRYSFRDPDADLFPSRIRILRPGVKIAPDPDPPHYRFLTFFSDRQRWTSTIVHPVFSQLVIKAVVDSSLRLGRQVDIENLPLRQFFVILDLVFKHGFKSGKVTLFSIVGSGIMFGLATLRTKITVQKFFSINCTYDSIFSGAKIWEKVVRCHTGICFFLFYTGFYRFVRASLVFGAPATTVQLGRNALRILHKVWY